MKSIKFIHFNDVYHISPARNNKEPVAGASRFVAKIKEILLREQEEVAGKMEKPLVFFSGDIFSPSLESGVTKGSHMIPVINECQIDVALLGNHDLDFGLINFINLSQQCQFPWILSNVTDLDSKLPLGKCQSHLILNRYNLKIGIIGLIEDDWLNLIPNLPDNLLYKDFIQVGKSLTNYLKIQENCDLVIALTHMRIQNDELLMENCPEIDLILGGHDHFYQVLGENISKLNNNDELIHQGNIKVLKSGVDFQDLSFGEIFINDQGLIDNIKIKRERIYSTIIPDPLIENHVNNLNETLSAQFNHKIGKTCVELDARSSSLRTKETNLGNWTADLLRYYYQTNACLICGGSIRSDLIYGPGYITVRDIMDIYPFEDSVVVLKILGKDLKLALENGLSKYPKQEGRFPVFSGLKIKWDSNLPSNSRILSIDILNIENSDSEQHFFEPLIEHKFYTLTTREYLASGYDGYESLKQGEYIIDPENGVLVSCIIRRYFTGVKVVNAISNEKLNLVQGVFKKLIRNVSEHKLNNETMFGSSLMASCSSEEDKYLPLVDPIVDGRLIDISNPNPNLNIN